MKCPFRRVSRVPEIGLPVHWEAFLELKRLFFCRNGSFSDVCTETERYVRMKKIIEVLRYGENDIRFHTDIDPLQDPETIHQTVTELAMAMMTTLWGRNEQAVLAMIRALAIADLGVSVNRRQMVGFLDDASGMLEASIRDARRAFEQSGGKIMVFGPGVAPPKSRS